MRTSKAVTKSCHSCSSKAAAAPTSISGKRLRFFLTKSLLKEKKTENEMFIECRHDFSAQFFKK